MLCRALPPAKIVTIALFEADVLTGMRGADAFLNESISFVRQFPHALYCIRKHQFIEFAHDRASAETALKRFSPEYGPKPGGPSQDDAMACHEAAFRSGGV